MLNNLNLREAIINEFNLILIYYLFIFKYKIIDKYFQKKINNIEVECLQTNCQWKGALSDYRVHHSDHFVIKTRKCEYCNMTLLSKDDLERHLDKINGDCPKQPIECIFKTIGCNKTLDVILNNENPAAAVGGGEEHMETGNDDRNTAVTNKNNFLRRENMNDHMLLHSNYHLELIHRYYYSELDDIKTKLEHLELREAKTAPISTEDLKPNVKDIYKDSGNYSMDSSSNKSASYENFNPDDSRFQLDNINPKSKKNQIETNTKAKNQIDTQPNTNFEFTKPNENLDLMNNKLDQTYQQLSDKIDRLENNQKGLISDLTRMTKNNDKLKQENQVLRENIKEYKTICQDLHKTLALTQVSLLTLEERLINQEKLSYNGTLLWKITNVHERIQEAKSGRQTSFYSPPFYTDRNGFKMCSRIYLNGDGNGRNTHLSLFFVILRGEYDALLKWPFRQKVTFILIDQSQSESKENVYDAFRPDPNSSSFRRPISEMNIASGLPVFCPLGKLMSTDHEYIKDNTMFIKIIVDTKDLTEV